MTQSTAGQHHSTGAYDAAGSGGLIILAHHPYPHHMAGAVDRGGPYEIEGKSVLHDLDAVVGRHRRLQRTLDLGSGGVGGMHYAGPAMTTLAGEGEIASGVGVEESAETDEPGQLMRPLLHQDAHGPFTAQPRPRHQGVVEMLLGVVGAVDGGGDATLSP